MATFEIFRKHWLWAVLAFLTTTILAVLALFLQYKSSLHEQGGFLKATFHNRNLDNKDSRTIVVCVEDTTIIRQNIYITPTFDNPDEYSLRDFSLVFESTCEGVEFIPSSFVKYYRTGSNSYYYKYDQDVLQAHMDTKNPFVGFKIKKDFARCEVISKVSFDGAANLFEYRTDIWFVYSPNTKGLSFDVWKFNCKQKVFNLIDDKRFDIYYIAKNNTTEYQFDVVVGSSNNNDKISISESKSENYIENNGSPTNNRLVTISPYKSEDAIANANLDIKAYNLVPGDSTQLTLFFNQPVSTTGLYILSFKVLDGWSLKMKYVTLTLTKGDMGCMKILNDNYRKIADLKLYHRINPNSHINIDKNFEGHIGFSINTASALVGLKYEDGGYYIGKTNESKFEKQFDKPVNIEIFDTKHLWWDRIIENEEGITWVNINICGWIVLILYFFAFAYLEDGSSSNKLYILSSVIVVTVSLFFAIYLICNLLLIFKYLLYYIYLMI